MWSLLLLPLPEVGSRSHLQDEAGQVDSTIGGDEEDGGETSNGVEAA